MCQISLCAVFITYDSDNSSYLIIVYNCQMHLKNFLTQISFWVDLFYIVSFWSFNKMMLKLIEYIFYKNKI